MTYFYPLPHKAYRFISSPIDTAPLVERYQLLMMLFHAMLLAGQPKAVLSVSRRVARLVKAYVKTATHNTHLRNKVDMLISPTWRARVLDDLGGLKALARWDDAVSRAQLRREGYLAPRRRHVNAEPVWWRTPERMAESERLKAYARDCARNCVNPRTLRDACKMDRDGLFRLAPLPREPRGGETARKVTIYTAQTINDYRFNAMPVYQPQGLGPAPVWPIEFYAAMGMKFTYERGQYEQIDLSHEPALVIEEGVFEDGDIITHDVILHESNSYEDNQETLIAFIGVKNYNYIFENPV